MPTNCVTVTRDNKGKVEIYVNGKITTEYHGQIIYDMSSIKEYFAEIQKLHPDIKAIHIGAFDKTGKFGKTSNPSGYGSNVWCCLEFQDGIRTSWVPDGGYGWEEAARNCARDFFYIASQNLEFMGKLLKAKREDLDPIEKSVDEQEVSPVLYNTT